MEDHSLPLVVFCDRLRLYVCFSAKLPKNTMMLKGYNVEDSHSEF